MTILAAEHRWECSNCPQTHVTHQPGPHTPFHSCSGLKGLTAPFVPAGTKAKVIAVEREDYVGSESVTTDGEDRPIMSVITVRENGQDCAVMAPTATSTARGES